VVDVITGAQVVQRGAGRDLPVRAEDQAPVLQADRGRRLLKADPRKIGGLRIDTGDVSQHDLIRETLYNDLDDDTATAAISLLRTDGPAGIPATAFEVTKTRYGAIPHAYVMCTRDNMVRPALSTG
jgi:hypothetical protein